MCLSSTPRSSHNSATFMAPLRASNCSIRFTNHPPQSPFSLPCYAGCSVSNTSDGWGHRFRIWDNPSERLLTILILPIDNLFEYEGAFPPFILPQAVANAENFGGPHERRAPGVSAPQIHSSRRRYRQLYRRGPETSCSPVLPQYADRTARRCPRHPNL